MPSPKDLGYRPFVVDPELIRSKIEFDLKPKSSGGMRKAIATLEPIVIPKEKKPRRFVKSKKRKKSNDSKDEEEKQRLLEEEKE